MTAPPPPSEWRGGLAGTRIMDAKDFIDAPFNLSGEQLAGWLVVAALFLALVAA